LDVHRLNEDLGGRWKGSGQESQSKTSSKLFSAMREWGTTTAMVAPLSIKYLIVADPGRKSLVITRHSRAARAYSKR
jgi:hypothetical protein